MELCITVPLSPRTPHWRDRTTEGSKASGCFVMRSRNALNNKQTGHCMPSSQDVLPSASMLAWIGGKKLGAGICWLVYQLSFHQQCVPGWPLTHWPVHDPCSFSYRTAKGASGLETLCAMSCCCELPWCYQGKGGRFCLREETEMFFPVPLTGAD